MSDAETCRICRVEGSASQPLIHPCKCRGSIKYIHEECLLEWLEHANRNNRAKRCDICNTAYKFVTLYDPNMPSTMPAVDVYRKLVDSLKSAVIKHIAAGLYLLCALQIPVYWKFVGRLCTYAVDGKMPSPEFSLFHVMAYGAYKRTRNGHLFTSSEADVAEKAITFLFNTYLSGLLQVVVFMLGLFVIFIENEWVVREEGYTKSLLREIGREPKTKLADLLGSIIRANEENAENRENDPLQPEGAVDDLRATENNVVARNDDENSRFRRTMATRALEYIRQDAAAAVPGAELHEALQNGQFAELMQEFIEREMAEPGVAGARVEELETGEPGSHSEHDHVAGAASSSSGIHDGAELSDSDTESSHHQTIDLLGDGSMQDHTFNGTAHEYVGEAANEPAAPVNNAPAAVPAPAPAAGGFDGRAQPNFPAEDDEAAEELERRRNIEDDEMELAEAANNDGNIFEIMGLRLQISIPIQLTFFVDIAALLLLFISYFLPHVLGSFIASVASYVAVGAHGALLAPVFALLPVSKMQAVLEFARQSALWQSHVVVVLRSLVAQQFIDPVVGVLCDIFALTRTGPPNYLARAMFLAIGYSVVCFAVHQLMVALTFGRKPVMGSARRVYKILFQITATAKVFAIFAIEIVLFPVYCGWLLDFCLAPLLVTEIVQQQANSATVYRIFLTSASAITSHFVVRFVLYWMWGTAYMFCIALFVSMTRNHILRPGVLYFIKSPEDPNARLIHDAVVKPIFLQMSRILLSAKVYTAFVVFGIGLVTWGLRFLVNAPGTKGALLPIKQFSVASVILASFTVLAFMKAQPVIAKYGHAFWKRSFAVLCHKFRLSHFILGSPVPQERGYVVYRGVWAKLFPVVPDYAKPVSYSEAMQIFKTDASVHACFVPNGSYIRAPSSDDNSRKFLRQLFVQVTKSDQLISPLKDETDEEDSDWWDADVVCDDTYAVVYSPPNLRSRCLALVCMVSVFGALLFVAAFILAALLGRPVFRAWMHAVEFAFKQIGANTQPFQGYEWAFADVDSLCIGLLAQLLCLIIYDAGAEGSVVLNFAAEQGRRIVNPAANARALATRGAIGASHRAWLIWFAVEIHFTYVPALEKALFGTAFVQVSKAEAVYSFNWPGFILHLLMGISTIIPQFTMLNMPMGSIQSWVRTPALFKIAASSVLIVSHKIYSWFYSTSPETEPLVQIAVLLLVVLARGAATGRALLEGITEQIKTEKYVRGTAVQNIEATDN